MGQPPLHFDPQMKKYCFRRVPESEVPLGRRQIAADILDFVIEDLDLANVAPKIVWVRPENPQVAAAEVHEANGRALSGGTYQCECFTAFEDFSGFVKDGSTRKILVRSDQNDVQLKHAIAHELRHIYQKKQLGTATLVDPDECDRDAYSYDAEAVARFERARQRE